MGVEGEVRNGKPARRTKSWSMADSREFGYAREAREAKQRMRNGASSRDLRCDQEGGGRGGGSGGGRGGKRLEVEFGPTERYPSAEEVVPGRDADVVDDGKQVNMAIFISFLSWVVVLFLKALSRWLEWP